MRTLRLLLFVAAGLASSCAAAGPAPTMRGFAVSRTEFHDGDSLVLDEVRGTHDAFVQGGVYRVRGRYTLASAERAHLALTTTNGRSDGEKEMDVERGSGTFDFTFGMVELGYPHLWMAPPEGGSAFCHLWFGTGPETSFQPGWEHEGSWGPERKQETTQGQGSATTPVPFRAVPLEFSAGDSVEITDFRGTRGQVEAGGSYILGGRYSLASGESADLVLLLKPAGGGEDQMVSQQHLSTGSGEVSLPFNVSEPGKLALLLCPSSGGDATGLVLIETATPAHADTKPTGWIDKGDTGFAFEGDRIEVEEVTGLAGPFVTGADYTVRGSYTLASHDKAHLAAYCTGGDLEGEHGVEVSKGSGKFEFTFRIAGLGRPHVSFYPVGGGNGFGNLYFDSAGKAVK